ncbi:hypothetical protein A0H81_10460 [Grifola frondosa]|uniref:Uncharacterized protein n=1 Tax=Grifola frondosa TaxID=5627 RepID=A0A1C7LYC1_GRIFR|nr:hypothetical protein A0H81_10460 [Grifola frondosa]
MDVQHNEDTPPAAEPDIAAFRDVVGAMKVTLTTLRPTFKTLNEQSAKMSTVGPTMDQASVHMRTLQNQIRAQEKKQDLRVQEVKDTIKNDIKKTVAEQKKAQIQESIRKEIAKQVKEQMDAQILEHMPMPLKQQAEESKQQLVEVKRALMNSEARRANSVLCASNLDDPLAVLKPDGTKSRLYPSDLRSLFSYESKSIQALLKDYELVQHELREKNLNRFMTHIGISFQMVLMPAPTKMQVTIPSP